VTATVRASTPEQKLDVVRALHARPDLRGVIANALRALRD
jgi:hypothetical protein